MRRFTPLKNTLPGHRLLVVMLLVWFLPQAAWSLQARPLSPSVVLVLKLVSTTRAQPTTGIVLTNEGLVMVPAEFIAVDGEIVVLDGGTDIIKNGRPAVVVDQAPASGWALLSVPGLDRPGITLSGTPPTTDSELHLSAFPPAEYIANGLPPLWADVKIVTGQADGAYSISAETPQPYVSGPILDDCGYLAGVSLTHGMPELKPGRSAQTMFDEDLKNALQVLQVELTQADCSQNKQKNFATLAETEAPANVDGQQENVRIDPNLLGPEVYNPAISRKRLNPFQGAKPRPTPVETPSLWTEIPLWLVLGAFIILTTLGWKALFFFRLHKKPADAGDASKEESEAIISTGEHGQENLRSAVLANPGMPDLNSLPEGCNGVLVCEVLVDSDTRFKRYCVVDTNCIDVRIGCNESDITITHPAISDAHARFKSDGRTMNLSDLGSASGTFIKSVPCIQGEVMYMEPGDKVFLGDIQLRFSVIKNDTTPS